MALNRQVAGLRHALSGIDVTGHAALCFVDAERRLVAKPFQIGEAWIAGI